MSPNEEVQGAQVLQTTMQCCHVLCI